MQRFEEAIRSIQTEGLLWRSSKPTPVGYGIKKMQITMAIVDDLVLVNTLIEDHRMAEPSGVSLTLQLMSGVLSSRVLCRTRCKGRIFVFMDLKSIILFG